MPERDEHGPVQSLMHEMRLDDADIERRKRAVGLDAADLPRLAAIKDLVIQRANEYTETFFKQLGQLEEGRQFVGMRALVERATQLKREHLRAMVSGDYGAGYVGQRLELAVLYARAGLEPRAFLGAFHETLRAIGTDLMTQFERTPLEAFERFMSLKKIAFFDIALIVDVLVFERERVIRQQHEAIRELSTPVLQIRERLLLLPIIGVIEAAKKA